MHDKSSFKLCSDGDRGMSALAGEMRGIVQRAAAPVVPGDTVKTQMRRAWQALGRPPFWRLRAAWYGEAAGWSARAVDDLRRRNLEREARALEHANKAAATLHSLRAAYAAGDADFHREQIVALDAALAEMGDRPRPVDGTRSGQ